MPHFPDVLKRRVLPFWNSAHARARRARLYTDALVRGRVERCRVCGRLAPMLYLRGVIPPRLEAMWGLTPALAAAFARKESNACGWCLAPLRARRLAAALLETYPAGGPAGIDGSLAAWARRPQARRLRIAEINHIPGVHDQLVSLPAFVPSDYRPETAAGTVSDGVRSEDLMALTYGAASFDLVLTSETLEHIPDLTTALREIWRILVPGGVHLFTIPVRPGVVRTFPRCTLRRDGTLEEHAPSLRHPGGDEGYLVFTEFGEDFPEILRRSGFEAEVRFGPATAEDVAQVYVARKV